MRSPQESERQGSKGSTTLAAGTPAPRLAVGTREIERLDADTPPTFSQDEVAQIVHDFKNPLATIALETLLLESDIPDLDPALVRRSAARISRNVEFLDRMVQDLLDLCAIDAGRFVIRRVPTELRAVVERVVDRAVATRDHDRVFLTAPEPVMLAIDDLRIERVVANLLENAFKYAPRETGITVRVDVRGDRACVAVIDAGPGLDVSERSEVFDQYRRGRSAGGCDGCGLGLYVSKRIVEAHGGAIGVDPVRGGGSRFFFELPLAAR
ncbi:MAG: sensor histidine kinase [Acidobacteriota bacterium]